jgi:hypothetical protein
MKPILKSNSSFLAVSPSPAWTTGQQSGYFMPLIQGSEVSISLERQSSKSVGSNAYAVNDLVRSPNVSFNINYLFSPYLVNENLFGISSPTTGVGKYIASGMSDRDQNFYLIINDKDGEDVLKNFTGTLPRTNFSGMTCMAVGNCFLTNYSLAFQVGSIPTATVSFDASNLQMTNLTGSRVSIPAINLQSGNNTNSGFLDFSNLQTSLSGYASGFSGSKPNVYRLPVLSPQGINASLDNLQMGGPVLVSGAILQSINLSVPFERTDLYGFGSNHVYGRKLQLPINATLDLSALITGFSSGNLHLINQSEAFYNFDITFIDHLKTSSGRLEVRGAKLNSVSHSMQVNGSMDFNANYSISTNELSGIRMFRL